MTHINHEWLPVLSDLCARDIPCVLITVTQVKGSTPREAGTKMLVTADDQFGTIGGGNLEFQAIDKARELLSTFIGNVHSEDYALGPSLAQCCGGSVSVLLEPFIKNNKTLYIFGAGHVGKELVKTLDNLPVLIKWVDQREGEFPRKLPINVKKIVTSSPEAEIRDMEEGSYIIVMTHSHDLDMEIVRSAFDIGGFEYLGLIGSDTKRIKFEKRLIAAGVKKEELSRLICPIGIDGITGKHPREIAISVAAELLGKNLVHQMKSK